MNRASQQMRNFAKRLIDHEISENKPSETKTPVAFHVTEKLRPHLVTLMGRGGFRALLSRSLALANAEVPSLRGVEVNPDGSLGGLEELHAELDRNKLSEVRVVLLAQLLGLLVAFIGENLTLRLVLEAWPKIPLNDLELGTEVKNEKTK